MNSPNDPNVLVDQKDFWDSLKLDILTSSQNLTKEDYITFIERSFILSAFIRKCPPIEIKGFQNILGLKDYAYIILIEMSEPHKSVATDIGIDELELHRLIKKILFNKSCAIGALSPNRITILISEHDMLTETAYREESTIICKDLAEALEKQYSLNIIAGIGRMQRIQSIHSSFIDALSCLHHNYPVPYIYYSDAKDIKPYEYIDYVTIQKHFIDAIRLNKVDAYDYFTLLMDYIRPYGDTTKRNIIAEILFIANNSIHLDSPTDRKQMDYMSFVSQLMNYSGDQLIDYAYQIFIYITNYIKSQNSIDYSNHIVKSTKEYLETHYTDDISLEDMADYVNISPQYFSKLIKKTTGFNFIDWLSMLRVKKAKELLTNSNLTVKEVCFMVGYKDPNYFSRIFKKRIGLTPSEYIKANSNFNNMN